MGALDGVWYGYYLEEQLGDPRARASHFPIKVRLAMSGAKIDGEMVDERPVTSRPLQDLFDAQRHRLNPKQREAFETILKRDYKARAVFTLPAESRIVGHIVGRDVFFTKHYQGIYRIEYVILGEPTLVFENARHIVEYRGELGTDSNAIEGQWIIRKRGLLGRWKSPDSQGRFRLDRR